MAASRCRVSPNTRAYIPRPEITDIAKATALSEFTGSPNNAVSRPAAPYGTGA